MRSALLVCIRLWLIKAPTCTHVAAQHSAICAHAEVLAIATPHICNHTVGWQAFNERTHLRAVGHTKHNQARKSWLTLSPKSAAAAVRLSCCNHGGSLQTELHNDQGFCQHKHP